jgi:hypothetical protein
VNQGREDSKSRAEILTQKSPVPTTIETGL